MAKNKIEGPFVALLITTLDSPAWQALSHGSKWLYVALKRRKSNNGNRAYISYRTAQKEIKSSTKKIGEWFAELKHYGFIELITAHSLGLDGKGKAPHWRLTECGRTSKASENGLFEPPTNDFLKWDGILFDPKPYRDDTGWDFQKQNPVNDVEYTPSTTSNTPPFPTSNTLKTRSVNDVVDIQRAPSVNDVVYISSLPLGGSSSAAAPAPSQHSPEGSLEEENKIGHFDERIIQLDETTKRLKAERRKARRAS